MSFRFEEVLLWLKILNIIWKRETNLKEWAFIFYTYTDINLSIYI